MGSSTTTTNNGVTTNEVHTANNNQNLSNDHTINETTNIRNWDIVHGNDIKGGLTEIDGLYNTGTQVFKLQQLNLSQPRVIASHVITDPIIGSYTKLVVEEEKKLIEKKELDKIFGFGPL